MTLIVDSGGLLAAMDPNQNHHEEFREALFSARGPRVISPFVVAELDYMILRDYGRKGQLAFLEEVDRRAYRLEPFDEADFSRARALVESYEHLTGFGIADASDLTAPGLFEQLDRLGVQPLRQIPFDRHAGVNDQAARPTFAQERESRSRRMISVESGNL